MSRETEQFATVTVNVHVWPETAVVAKALRSRPQTVTVDIGEDLTVFLDVISVETLIGALIQAREILASPPATAAA